MERVLEARQDDTWLTRIYPRVREREGKKDKEKGREKSKGVFPPAQVFQTLYPATYFKQPSHFIANSRLLYEVYLWDPADYHNIKSVVGRGREEVNIHKAHNKELGFGLYTLFTFLLHFYFKHRKKNKKVQGKKKED